MEKLKELENIFNKMFAKSSNNPLAWCTFYASITLISALLEYLAWTNSHSTPHGSESLQYFWIIAILKHRCHSWWRRNHSLYSSNSKKLLLIRLRILPLSTSKSSDIIQESRHGCNWESLKRQSASQHSPRDGAAKLLPLLVGNE